MKEIALTKNKAALVDDSLFHDLSRFEWYCSKQLYACRGNYIEGKRHGIMLMHRYILKALPGQCVDHINGNTLDNRINNLRICNQSENNMNRKNKNAHNKSGYTGVFWKKHAKKWSAQISYKNKSIHLGYFNVKEDAARAYNQKCLNLFGEFAKVNKI